MSKFCLVWLGWMRYETRHHQTRTANRTGSKEDEGVRFGHGNRSRVWERLL
jgi:hypothetical protein